MLISPSYVATLETNIKKLFDQAYANLARHMWWECVATHSFSSNREERVFFALEQAYLSAGGQGGFKTFNDLAYLTTVTENEYTQSALRITEAQLADYDGVGIKLATDWTAQTGRLCAHHPQKLVAKMLLANGGNGANTYDGLSLFHANHLLNGRNTDNGTFTNVKTAVPIDDSVGLDVAKTNLNKAIALMRGQQTPTGYPRNLEPKWLIVPPEMWARAQELTTARVAPAGSQGGSVDNMPFLNSGIGTAVCAPELGAGFPNGSATSYYLVADIPGDGAAIYFDREPFAIRQHSGMTEAQLDVADELVYVCKGRNSILPLHPFAIQKCVAT
jgi:phage major head subunit gpT-like protein